MEQEEPVLHNITLLIFLVWCSMKSFVTEPCLQETEGKPSNDQSDNRWVGICSQGYSPRWHSWRGGKNEFPAALPSSLPLLPSCYLFQWQGQEPIMPLHFLSLQITHLCYLPIRTWPWAGNGMKRESSLTLSWPPSLGSSTFLFFKMR